MKHLLCAALFAAASTVATAAPTEEADFSLVIQDHHFKPEEITIPANKKVKILVDNRDDTPEEFDSHDLNREKVVMGNTKGIVFIGPLKPGRYKFQGEFHAATAQGVVVAK